MKQRFGLAAIVIVGLATLANAAELRFFLTSPLAQPNAQTPAAAATNKENPVISGANALLDTIPISIWMQIVVANAVNPAEGEWAQFGGNLDAYGDNDGANAAAGGWPLNNPAGRWAGGSPMVSAAGPFVAVGGQWNATATGLPKSTAGDVAHADGPIFLLFSGNISKALGQLPDPGDGFFDVFLSMPDGTAIANNDSANFNTAGVAFGWNAGGEDTSSLYSDGVTPTFPHPNGGTYAFTFGTGDLRSDNPDLRIEAPEPATMALLGLAGLFIRRRR